MMVSVHTYLPLSEVVRGEKRRTTPSVETLPSPVVLMLTPPTLHEAVPIAGKSTVWLHVKLLVVPATREEWTIVGVGIGTAIKQHYMSLEVQTVYLHRTVMFISAVIDPLREAVQVYEPASDGLIILSVSTL